MIVHVTSGDIVRGIPLNAIMCPVARAIGRKGVSCLVGQTFIIVRRVSYRTDPALHDWLATFDRFRPVAPITIEFVEGTSTDPIGIARIIQPGSPESSTP